MDIHKGEGQKAVCCAGNLWQKVCPQVLVAKGGLPVHEGTLQCIIQARGSPHRRNVLDQMSQQAMENAPRGDHKPLNGGSSREQGSGTECRPAA
jgi:hypothetical protein